MDASTERRIVPAYNDFDKERSGFSYAKYQCERLGCDHPTTYYPSFRHGSKVLVCTLCHIAEREWFKLCHEKKSLSRERSYADERIPALPSDDLPNGQIA